MAPVNGKGKRRYTLRSRLQREIGDVDTRTDIEEALERYRIREIINLDSS